jgi:hypothetical protein
MRDRSANIARRNLADFVRTGMADRRAKRKKNAADESRLQKGMAAEEWAPIQEVRNREWRQQLEQPPPGGLKNPWQFIWAILIAIKAFEPI